MCSIGQLAGMNDVTVRTLMYYDEIGLLSPAEVGSMILRRLRNYKLLSC
ncbi:MerR family DNA-binding transcriptional regulator [Virgibacillus dakarensis]|nr:MerR family DNA-binding transcriptional regulator [Virgibacillus dakarensis]MTW87365.1 MerR family DNA-binding transcriptional regulator [Virgibacillus dakarensis]